MRPARIPVTVAGVVAVWVVAVWAVLLQPPPALAAAPQTTGIRLVDAPTNRIDDPRARLYIVDHLRPGTTINRRVEVSNDTDAPRTFALYAGAASVDDGVFAFGEGRAPNELTTWTVVEPASMTLPPGGRQMATVTIAVPRDASPGERYGVVWEEVGAAVPAGGGIGMVNRVGIRIYLSVGPGGEPPSEFAIGALTGRRDGDGVPVVSAEVRNTGGRALNLAGELRLDEGPGGLSAGPFPVALAATLGVGESGTSELRLDPALPDGPWTATLRLRAGTAEHATVETIRFTAAAPAPAVSAGTVQPPDDDASRLREIALVGGVTMIAVTGGAALALARGLGWFSLGAGAASAADRRRRARRRVPTRSGR